MPESLFQKSCRPEACNFIKKETLAQVFSCEFCEISTNTFFTEHLWTTAFLIQPVTLFLLEMLINKKTRHFDSSLNHQEHLFHRTCYHQLFSSYEYCKVFKNSYFIEHLQRQCSCQCSSKQQFLKVSQTLRESTCVGVSF